MAWTANATDFGTSNKIATGIVTTLGPNRNVSISDVAIVIVCKDNTSTTSGVTNEITAVTDSKGNWWQKLGERTSAQGAASAGATVAIFASTLTATLATGVDTISATIANSVNASCMSGWSFTFANNARVAVVASTGESVTSATYGSVAISGLDSREYLFFRGIALEGKTFSFTNTANFTAVSTDFADLTGTASSISVHGEFRIFTGTNLTSAPGNGMGTAPSASVYIAILEDTSPVGLAICGAGR